MPKCELPATPAEVAAIANIWDISLEDVMRLVTREADQRKVRERAAKLNSNVFDDSLWEMFFGKEPQAAGPRAVIIPLCDKCDKPIEEGMGVVIGQPMVMATTNLVRVTPDRASAYHFACLKKLLDQYAMEYTTSKLSGKGS